MNESNITNMTLLLTRWSLSWTTVCLVRCCAHRKFIKSDTCPDIQFQNPSNMCPNISNCSLMSSLNLMHEGDVTLQLYCSAEAQKSTNKLQTLLSSVSAFTSRSHHNASYNQDISTPLIVYITLKQCHYRHTTCQRVWAV